MEKIKIFLADDHQILRESLKLLLEQQEDFSVVGEAEDGLAVEPGIREHPADVLLLDVSMPKKNGFEVARSLSRDRSRNPGSGSLSLLPPQGQMWPWLSILISLLSPKKNLSTKGNAIIVESCYIN